MFVMRGTDGLDVDRIATMKLVPGRALRLDERRS
jgi:hypothetical protein